MYSFAYGIVISYSYPLVINGCESLTRGRSKSELCRCI